MINKLRIIILSLSSTAVLFTMTPPALVHADNCDTNGDGVVSTQEAIQCGVSGANGGNHQTPAQATDKFNHMLRIILNTLTVVAGLTAVIMIVVSGFRFVTSGGNPERVKSARSALVYAIIGIAVVALSQIIVQFVLQKSTGS